MEYNFLIYLDMLVTYTYQVYRYEVSAWLANKCFSFSSWVFVEQPLIVEHRHFRLKISSSVPNHSADKVIKGIWKPHLGVVMLPSSKHFKFISTKLEKPAEKFTEHRQKTWGQHWGHLLTGGIICHDRWQMENRNKLQQLELTNKHLKALPVALKLSLPLCNNNGQMHCCLLSAASIPFLKWHCSQHMLFLYLAFNLHHCFRLMPTARTATIRASAIST